jgi:hypothetical protein
MTDPDPVVSLRGRPEERTELMPVIRDTGMDTASSAAFRVLMCVTFTIGIIVRYRTHTVAWVDLDEPASLLAIEMVARKGAPLFPSDVLYLQGAVFSYLTAPLAWFLDADQLLNTSQVISLTLGSLSILFAMATVRLLCGSSVAATVTGLLIALDPTLISWDITIRPYAMLTLATAIIIYLVTRLIVNGPDDRIARVPVVWLAATVMVVGTFSHISFWLPMPAVIVVSFLVWKTRIFTIHRRLGIAAIISGLGLVAYLACSRLVGVGSGTSTGDSDGLFVGSHLLGIDTFLTRPDVLYTTWYRAFIGGQYLELVPLIIILCSGIVLGHAGGGAFDDRKAGMLLVLAAHWSIVGLVTVLLTVEPQPRYLVHSLPPGYILIGLVVGLAMPQISTAGFRTNLRPWLRIAGIGILLLPLFTYAVTAADWRLSKVGFNPDYWRITGLARAAYQPGDIVIATLPPAVGVLFPESVVDNDIYYLAGPVGNHRAERYSKRYEDGSIGDYWLGGPLITTEGSLCHIMAQHQGNALFILDRSRLTGVKLFGAEFETIILGTTNVVVEEADHALVLRSKPIANWSAEAKALCVPLIT